jgi:hypothetical protein
MISYDDAATFSEFLLSPFVIASRAKPFCFPAAKGQFIVEKGLKGFSIWHAVGDENNILLDAVNSALSR